MSWILIKVGSDLLAAGNIVLAKKMLAHHVSDRRLYIFSVALVSIPFAVFGLYYLTASVSLLHVFIALLAGMSYITAGHFYYLALAAEQPYRMSLISRMSPVLTLILSALILKEKLTITQQLGFTLAFVGGLVLVVERNKGFLRVDDSARYGLASAVAAAFSITLIAYLLREYPLWQTFTMTRVGVLVGTSVLLGLRSVKIVVMNLRALHPRYSGILLSEQIIRLISLFLHTVAVAQIGSPSLVAVLSGFTPLYVWTIATASGNETSHSRKLLGQFVVLLLLLVSSFLMAQ